MKLVKLVFTTKFCQKQLLEKAAPKAAFRIKSLPELENYDNILIIFF